jgi:predicted RND superfamily exporter protein
VLVLSLLLAAVSLYWAYENLGLKLRRLALINPNSGFNQLWLDYIDEFGDENEVIVVVEGKDNAEITSALELLAERIKKYPEFYQDILHGGMDLSAIRQKGLHFVPVKDLQKIYEYVESALQGQSAALQGQGILAQGNALGNGNTPTTSRPVRARQEENLALTGRQINGGNTESQGVALGYNAPPLQGVNAESDKLLSVLTESDYFLFPTPEGYIGFVLLRLINIDKTQFSQGTESIENLRSIIGKVRSDFPALEIGLTGMPILEYDEMKLSNDAMSQATILALVGVCIIFMAGFGSLRHPLLAMLALMVAFAWTMGYITLAVGHLNILSIAFGAMLIGLGTDFSVHYLGKYLDLRRSGWDVVESLCQTAELVGPGIVTGAITTSTAFYAASFAEFTGVAELGKIAGGGILFCAISTFTVFPALIMLATPTEPGKSVPSGNLLDIRSALQPVFVFPKMTLFLFALGFGYLLLGIYKVEKWYDHNLLNLQPVGLESVEWEQRLLSLPPDKGGKNVWFALSIADTEEELLKRKNLFEEKYPELKTEEFVSFADPERLRIIQSLAQLLSNIPSQYLPEQMQALKAMAMQPPPTLDDLPPALVSRFKGKHGKHLMRIYTTANIWDMDEMEEFVTKVRSIDKYATGSPLQTYESSKQMQEGFITAAYYALACVLFFAWVDFRSIGATLAALLPMFLGFTMMLGIIGWLDVPLNPANMIVLPLVLGIGIDYGIHLIHDFRNRKYKRYTVSASTATSILITSLTTIIGFGSMMIASHRGLQSLGRVLVIGIFCCLITSLVVLPAILSLWTRNEREEPVDRSSPPKRKRLVRRV